MSVFHLAIPTHDLDAAERFYVGVLQAVRARRYDDRVTFRFFDHQIVCHLAPDAVDREVRMYPRHFGLTFENGEDFDACYQRCQASGWPFYRDKFVRFDDRPERHQSFFLVDPSNNVIEFKHYDDSSYMY